VPIEIKHSIMEYLCNASRNQQLWDNAFFRFLEALALLYGMLAATPPIPVKVSHPLLVMRGTAYPLYPELFLD
jgi:hypothetical protein